MSALAGPDRAAPSGAASSVPPGERPLSWWSPVRLGVEREVVIRLRSKGFRVALAITLLATAAAVVVPALVKPGSSVVQAGVVGSPSSVGPVRTVLRATARHDGIKLHVHTVPSAARARYLVRAGKLRMAVVAGPPTVIVVKTAPSATASPTDAFVVQSSYQLGLGESIARQHLTSAQVAAVLSPAPVAVQPLRHPAGHPAGIASFNARKGVAMAGVLATLILLQFGGGWILMGVIQEKSTRVIEVLLAAVRPLQLLTAKILGIGVVIVGQAALMVAVAVAAGAVVGSSILAHAAPAALGMAAAWLLLGYAFYSVLFAAAGSLVSRQEDAQALMVPLILPITIGYATAFPILVGGSSSLLLRVLAWLPPTAPFDMPAMYAAGAVALWQVAASALLLLLSTVVAIRLAGRIYSGAIMRTGQRVRIRQALKA
ncbi:MAG: ABC transporter permease [Actinomycetota bacterium]|nr:ABC transporter permease [Actinomycetota bacterium]